MDNKNTNSANDTKAVNQWAYSGQLRRRYINAAKKQYFYEVEQGFTEYSLAELVKRMRRAERCIDEAFNDFARQLAIQKKREKANEVFEDLAHFLASEKATLELNADYTEEEE
jgi:DNA helicase IV